MIVDHDDQTHVISLQLEIDHVLIAESNGIEYGMMADRHAEASWRFPERMPHRGTGLASRLTHDRG
jgi:hypothetical protein